MFHRGDCLPQSATAARTRDTVCVSPVDPDEEFKLAQRLYDEWQAGKPKSRIERETWDDGRSHGRRFDRFISVTLGRPTVKRSKLSDRVTDLEDQVRSLGHRPAGAIGQPWERQLSHARQSCLSALRIWNDPMATFRTEAFSLLLVTAWNALCIAILQKRGDEWRAVDAKGNLVQKEGEDKALDTSDLVAQAFSGDSHVGLREMARHDAASAAPG